MHRRIAWTSSISSLSVGASMSIRGGAEGLLHSGDCLMLSKVSARQTFGASWRSWCFNSATTTRFQQPIANAHRRGVSWWTSFGLLRSPIDGGRQLHVSLDPPGAFERDREQDQHLTLAGYTVVRFTYKQVAQRARARPAPPPPTPRQDPGRFERLGDVENDPDRFDFFENKAVQLGLVARGDLAQVDRRVIELGVDAGVEGGLAQRASRRPRPP